jgi:hypothetical protein
LLAESAVSVDHLHRRQNVIDAGVTAIGEAVDHVENVRSDVAGRNIAAASLVAREKL